jgi:ribosomal protein L17
MPLLILFKETNHVPRATSNTRSSQSNYTHPPYTFQQQTNKQESQMSSNLYTEIIQYEQMTNTFDRDSFIADYAEQVVDGMDMDTLAQFAFDMLVENMERMSDSELVKDANNYHSELLAEYNIDPDMYL